VPTRSAREESDMLISFRCPYKYQLELGPSIMRIRKEAPSDTEAIEAVTIAAFRYGLIP
jgi:hypothetical protein